MESDRPWLTVMAVATIAELCWWAAAWSAGIAPAPYTATYLALTFAGLAAILAVRWITGAALHRSLLPSLITGALLVGIGSSLFLPLKYAIPAEIPFWLDRPLAAAERGLFGADPWLLLDRMLGWAAVPIDRIYGLWLPVQAVVLLSIMSGPRSPAKSRALIAYSLAWLGLGVVAAALFSSAGPLFYDRLFGGGDFARLGPELHARGAAMAMAESDAMWTAFESRRPGLVAGMSAMPSLHVAISLWMYLAARELAPRAAPAALGYALFMWVASVQLGWHYVSDGLAGMAGMLAIWALSGTIQRALGCKQQTPPAPVNP